MAYWIHKIRYQVGRMKLELHQMYIAPFEELPVFITEDGFIYVGEGCIDAKWNCKELSNIIITDIRLAL